jgi:hypothetical protein
MHSRPKWISQDTWVCFKHIPMAKIPAAAKICWYCKDAQPDSSSAPPSQPTPRHRPVGNVVAGAPGKGPCAWPGCSNTASSISKYCSRQCSNKNARARAADRKSEPVSPEPAAE